MDDERRALHWAIQKFFLKAGAPMVYGSISDDLRPCEHLMSALEVFIDAKIEEAEHRRKINGGQREF
jgi:hypothetical protein